MALIVNGERIGDEVLGQEFGQIKAAAEAADPTISCCERDPEFRAEAERNVVARVLLVQRAMAVTEEPGEGEVDGAIGQLAEQMGGWERFHAAYGRGAERDEAIRSEVALNVRLNRMVDEAMGERAEVSEQELRAYHAANPDRFMTAERVRASHILKRGTGGGAGRDAAFEEVREIRRALLSGADFDGVARERSDRVRELEEERRIRAAGEGEVGAVERGVTGAGREGGGGDGAGGSREPKEDGVDLGWFAPGELMEEFSRPAFSMEVGEVSPVICSPFGFHIVKVTGREEARVREFEEVREEVRAAVLAERRAAVVEEMVERLRGEASVERVDVD